MNLKDPVIKIEFLTDDVEKIALAMKYWTYEKGSFIFDLDELLVLHHNKSKRELAHTVALYATAWLPKRICSLCKGRLTADSRTDAISKIRDPGLNTCVQCAQMTQDAQKKRLIEEKEAEVARLAVLEAQKRALYKKRFNDLCSQKTDLEQPDDTLALCIGTLEHSLGSVWRDQRLASSDVYKIFGWPRAALLDFLVEQKVLRQDPYKMDYEQFKLSGCGTKLEPIDLGAIKFQLPFKSQGGTIQRAFDEKVKTRNFTNSRGTQSFLAHVYASECTVYLLHLLRSHAIYPAGALLNPESKLLALLTRTEKLFIEAASKVPLSEAWKRTWVCYKRTIKAPWAGHSLEGFARALESNIAQELQKPLVTIHQEQAWRRACPPTPMFEFAALKLGFTESSTVAA